MQEAHLQTIIEVLQSIKASDMSPLLKRIYESEGGNECLDVLMKYMSVQPNLANVDKLKKHIALTNSIIATKACLPAPPVLASSPPPRSRLSLPVALARLARDLEPPTNLHLLP